MERHSIQFISAGHADFMHYLYIMSLSKKSDGSSTPRLYSSDYSMSVESVEQSVGSCVGMFHCLCAM